MPGFDTANPSPIPNDPLDGYALDCVNSPYGLVQYRLNTTYVDFRQCLVEGFRRVRVMHNINTSPEDWLVNAWFESRNVFASSRYSPAGLSVRHITQWINLTITVIYPPAFDSRDLVNLINTKEVSNAQVNPVSSRSQEFLAYVKSLTDKTKLL